MTSSDVESLIFNVAYRVSRALNLEKNNEVLAKDVIRKAQRTDDFHVFQSEVAEDGIESESLQKALFSQIKSFEEVIRDERRRGKTSKGIKVEGFSTAIDHLDDDVARDIDGGLYVIKQEPRHELGDESDSEDQPEKPVFRKPDRPRRSLLGLDKLAEVKREERDWERRGLSRGRYEDHQDRRDAGSRNGRRSPDRGYRSRSGRDHRSYGRPGRRPEIGRAKPAPAPGKIDDEVVKREEQEFDRQFYNDESAFDEGADPFLADDKKVQMFEEALKQRNLSGYKVSAKQSQISRDMNKWEQHQLLTSGVMSRTAVDHDHDDEMELGVHLLIKDIKPPFLDKDIQMTKLKDPVQPVKDPTSDIAKLSRKGSTVLREMIRKRDRTQGRKKFWELAGSQMGAAMGIKKDHQFEENEDESGTMTGNFKKDSQYGTHMKQKNEASSQFALSLSLKQQREYLPIFAVRSELMQTIRDFQVVIIIGETGSGKTTQLTQYLREDGYCKGGKIVACTQPRRVAAMSVAKRVSEEMDVNLGTSVGYTIRFEDCTSPETQIKYMTDGVLLRESIGGSSLEKYSCIIMDEAHERSLNTDVLFGVLRRLLSSRPDLKLLITSATLNAQKFSQFFGNAPCFNIPGRTFPVQIAYQKTPCEDYVDAAAKQILSIHLQRPAGDILVFMTGQADVECTCMHVAERLSHVEDAPKLILLPIYSQLPADLQARIFQKAEKGSRKCIVATNIAETSLTVDGIYYVVDTGFCKIKVYNPRIGMDALQVFPVSKANSDQRSGRAGRTGPGECYRLYTERAYVEELLENTVPEIQRTHLANVCLLLKSLGIDNLLDFDFMDPPPTENIEQSLYQLWVLGALDNFGNMTILGKKMVAFPLDPPLSKMLITGADLNCTEEVVTIAAMLSTPPVWFRPKERADEADAMREKFTAPESDHLTLLNVYNQWAQHNYSKIWTTEHYLQQKALLKVREIRQQLVEIMEKTGIALVSCGINQDNVRKTIAASFFHHTGRMKGIGEYINMRTSMPCHLHPTSALYGLGYTPEYVVYHELIYTSKEYMQCVTSVDPLWLARLGSIYFYIKEEGVSKSDQRKKERKEREELEKQRDEMEQRKREREVAEEKARPTKKRKVVEVGANRQRGTRGRGRMRRRMGM